MIAGAAQADVGVLVISARKGEFETGFEGGGQTREHVVLAKTLGIKRLIVLINKMDDPTVAWQELRFKECLQGLRPFLRNSGYNLETDISFIPVSGQHGHNLKTHTTAKECSWYSGPTFLDFIDTMPGGDRLLHGPFILPIANRYKDLGTNVTGKIASGRVRTGDGVIVRPNNRVGEVAQIFLDDGSEEVQLAIAGDNVRLVLRNIKDEEIFTGYTLCSLQHPVSTVRRFKAQLKLLDIPSIFAAGFTAVMHLHTAVVEIKVHSLVALLDPRTGKVSKPRPRFARKGDVVSVVMDAASPVCAATFTDHPVMGRFSLREGTATTAIGKITELPNPAKNGT